MGKDYEADIQSYAIKYGWSVFLVVPDINTGMIRFVGTEVAKSSENQEFWQGIKGNAMKTEQLLELAIQIADGFDAGYSQDIVHRDVIWPKED